MSNVFKVDNLLTNSAEIWIDVAEKASWTRQTEGKNLVCFGKIKRKSAKITMTAFTYCSPSYLFYGGLDQIFGPVLPEFCVDVSSWNLPSFKGKVAGNGFFA
jgi:hypothetical protein